MSMSPSTRTPDASAGELVINRIFAAPRDLVYKAWTEPERLARWWGPAGCDLRVARLDLRPGGVFLYAMEMPNTPPIWGKFTYREIVPPERLVFTNAFADEQGNSTRNPWMPVWPLEILNTLTLEEQDGNTSLTLRGGPLDATDEELRNFQTQRSGMQEGFGGTFDKLDAYLASAR